MKIAILGTRGIPNNYGGFEQFAEYLGAGLVQLGHEVTVYNPTSHPFKDNFYKGIKIISKNNPEKIIGSFANFYYDWICSYDASKRDYDIVYHAGYQSAAPGIKYFAPKSNSIWLTNMDGLEWKRDKWSKPIKWLTKIMEKMALKYSDYIISDNVGIQKHYEDIHNAKSFFLAYGADVPSVVSSLALDIYKIKEFDFSLIIARLEPENNIETIIEGYIKANINEKLIIVGNYKTKYGNYLLNKYKRFSFINFVGGIYDKAQLDCLRKFAKFYFHGHTVGGTNPSLLESMAVGANIIAHDNQFNKSVLQDGALFFNNSKDISNIINESNDYKFIINRKKVVEIINEDYSWDKIISQHIEMFMKVLN
jgi:hypothetical protein